MENRAFALNLAFLCRLALARSLLLGLAKHRRPDYNGDAIVRELHPTSPAALAFVNGQFSTSNRRKSIDDRSDDDKVASYAVFKISARLRCA